MATVLLTKYYLGHQIEKNKIGRTFSMYGEKIGEVYKGFFGGGNLREGDYLEATLMGIKETCISDISQGGPPN